VPQLKSPFFDSAAHPTLDGSWISHRRGQTFEELAALRSKRNYDRVLAIGLPNIGNYNHVDYKLECDKYSFEAVAALTNYDKKLIPKEVEVVAKLGYRAIKVHPKLLRRNQNLDYLADVFDACVKHELACLFCTYEADSPGCLPETDPFYTLCRALNQNPEIRLILMHGGYSRLQQFSGLARHSERILLDLSFTAMTSSTTLQAEIRSIMQKLDQRICIGTDSPEISLAEFMERVTLLTEGLPKEKLSNIMYQNLDRFFPK
jgi:predicted TIM-barrel fold metal-dependent hydrolase